MRAMGRIFRFPIDLRRRPYNTLALPCECVTKDWPPHAISLPEKFSSLDIVAVTVCTDVGPIRYYITAYTAHPSSTNLGAKIWFCY